MDKEGTKVCTNENWSVIQYNNCLPTSSYNVLLSKSCVVKKNNFKGAQATIYLYEPTNNLLCKKGYRHDLISKAVRLTELIKRFEFIFFPVVVHDEFVKN